MSPNRKSITSLRSMLVLVCVLIFTNSEAQTWIEEGHDIRFWRVIDGQVWDHTGCDVWSYTNDTLIDAMNYQVLEGTYEYYDVFMGDTIFSGIDNRPNIYLTSSGDSTWFYLSGERHLLSNFNAQVGDEWDIPVEQPTTGIEVPDMHITVDSLGTTMTGVVERDVMYYSYEFEFDGGCIETGNGQVVRGLFHKMDTSSEFILPIMPDLLCTLDANDLYFFAEFSSMESDGYSESVPGNYSCTSIDVGIYEDALNDALIYPNPANLELFIDAGSKVQLKNIELIDVTGKRVFSEDYSRRIDISHIAQGTYILKINADNGQVLIKELVIY